MEDGSRWQRWGRWPYQVVGWAMVLSPLGIRLRPSTGLAQLGLSVLGLLCAVGGLVLVAGPRWHRARRAQDEEVRRNPTGKPVPLEERLAAVSHPRARWVLSVVAAVALTAATGWTIYEAVTQHQSSFVGLAILFFVPVPVLVWLAWRTRALRHGRPST